VREIGVSGREVAVRSGFPDPCHGIRTRSRVARAVRGGTERGRDPWKSRRVRRGSGREAPGDVVGGTFLRTATPSRRAPGAIRATGLRSCSSAAGCSRDARRAASVASRMGRVRSPPSTART
jgi:hypothetical protein